MLTIKKVVTCLVILFCFHLLFNFQLMDLNAQDYVVEEKQYEYNFKTKKSTYRSGGAVSQSIYLPAHIRFDFFSEDGGTRSRVGGGGLFSSDLGDSLENYIIHKLGIKGIKYHIPRKQIEKSYCIFVKPAVNGQNSIIDIFFGIEIYHRLNQYGDNVFKIDRYVLSKDEFKKSKQFSFTNKGIHLDKLIPDDDRIKMVLSENSEIMRYATFEIKVFGKSQEYELAEEYSQIKPPIDRHVIDAPFTYDIKYKNSEGMVQIIEGVHQSEEFSIKVQQKESKNSLTHELEYVKYTIRGKIFPVQFENSELNIMLSIIGESNSYDSKFENKIGGGSFGYGKTILFKPDDVVEVKLAKYSGIEEQSLFIMPIKIKK